MLTLSALLLMANFASLLHLPVLLEYLFAGILLGGTASKFVVGWHERGGDVLSTARVRHIERLWIAIGVGAMALAAAVQVALTLL
jgi:hypothetical protein